jgi:hypothetical protein
VRKSVRETRAALGVRTIEPALPTRAEVFNMKESNASIQALAKQGMSIKQIVRASGHSRKIVRHVAWRTHGCIPRSGQPLEPYLVKLDDEWSAGCRNGAEHWRRIRPRASAS